MGVTITGAVNVDMRRVKARKDAISETHQRWVEKWLRQMENCTIYEGHAQFESARVVRVGSETVRADHIFINVGGRALVPPFPGLEHVQYLTNRSMMDVDFVPERLLIVGGSYIGAGIRPNVPTFRKRSRNYLKGVRACFSERTKMSPQLFERSWRVKASTCT